MTWQTQRSMTPDDLVGVMETLGLSQAATGRFVGLSERQIARMIHGEAEIPTAIALLLHAMIHHNETPLVPKRIARRDNIDTGLS